MGSYSFGQFEDSFFPVAGNCETSDWVRWRQAYSYYLSTGELGISRGYISYCASRGGMNMMIKQLATEWAKYGITVNGIAPTFTRTSLVARYLDDPAFYKPLVARIPLGRVCEPCDIAGLAMYLASHASDFITGQIICVDGGLTATQ